MKKASIKIVLKSKINKFGLDSKEVKSLEDKVASKLDIETWTKILLVVALGVIFNVKPLELFTKEVDVTE